MYGIARSSGITISHVTTADDQTVDTLTICHELLCGEIRYIKAGSELVVVSCIHCGATVRLDWRPVALEAMPWGYTEHEHGCGGILPAL